MIPLIPIFGAVAVVVGASRKKKEWVAFSEDGVRFYLRVKRGQDAGQIVAFYKDQGHRHGSPSRVSLNANPPQGGHRLDNHFPAAYKTNFGGEIGRRLTAKQRRELPASMYVFPKDRAYPIPDRSHAMAARSYASRALNEGRMSKSDVRKVWKATNRRFGMPMNTLPTRGS